MYDDAALPGFLASLGEAPVRGAREDGAVATTTRGAVTLTSWGTSPSPGSSDVVILSRVVRDGGGEVEEQAVVARMRDDPSTLARLLPPFAAVAADEHGATMVADSMGFRQLFHSEPGDPDRCVMSTSALLAGRQSGASLDEVALGVQSQLGWQLGQRTLHTGIRKLAPGAVASLGASGIVVDHPQPVDGSPIVLAEAVTQAAAVLRESLEVLLDDHPDAVLQLTGGMDSRLLLAAVPRSRRRGLRAMTLGDADSGDVRIASQLAARDGIRHEVYRAADISGVRPDEAWEASRSAAIRLDGMADPITLAVLGWDERSFDQGVRISGLGGEVARGFYYLGAVHDRPVTAHEASRLGAWRMFVNESVEPGMLVDDFAAAARHDADAELFAALSDGDAEWFRATDSLYLRHRMQRWAGTTDTAVAYQRIVVNPMLDERFLGLAQRLAPQQKADSRFLASLLMELDPDLGGIPLEGRLAPASYANPTAWQGLARRALLARKLARKAAQRLRGTNRAAEGNVVLADKVVEHWRANSALLEPLAATGLIDEAWIDGVLAGRIDPRPSSVGFLTNMLVASGQSV